MVLVAWGEAKTGEDGLVCLATDVGGNSSALDGGKVKTGEEVGEDGSLVEEVAHLVLGLAIVDECNGAGCSWVVKHGLHLNGSGKPHFNLFTQLK